MRNAGVALVMVLAVGARVVLEQQVALHVPPLLDPTAEVAVGLLLRATPTGEDARFDHPDNGEVVAHACFREVRRAFPPSLPMRNAPSPSSSSCAGASSTAGRSVRVR